MHGHKGSAVLHAPHTGTRTARGGTGARGFYFRHPVCGGVGVRACTAAAQEATASCASPANTRCSTQRYSRDRQPSVRCTGGYQAARASGALSRCARTCAPLGRGPTGRARLPCLPAGQAATGRPDWLRHCAGGRSRARHAAHQRLDGCASLPFGLVLLSSDVLVRSVCTCCTSEGRAPDAHLRLFRRAAVLRQRRALVGLLRRVGALAAGGGRGAARRRRLGQALQLAGVVQVGRARLEARHLLLRGPVSSGAFFTVNVTT